jgi:hypothetical protein
VLEDMDRRLELAVLILSSWTKIFMYITVSVLIVPHINRVSAG